MTKKTKGVLGEIKLNSKHDKKLIDVLKAFVLLTLFMMISGCGTSSEVNTTDNNTASANQRTGEKANSSPEEAKKPNNVNSNAEQSANSNSSANANLNKESSTAETVVTHEGFGKIKVGMTITEASQAFGTELVAPNGKGECYYVQPKQGFKGVDFMVIEGKIARIDVKSKEYATDKGAKIGDTEEKIKSLYKGAEVLPQKYDEKKHDIEAYSNDKKYLIIFETDGKIVTGFRAGRSKEVGLVERCG